MKEVDARHISQGLSTLVSGRREFDRGGKETRGGGVCESDENGPCMSMELSKE